MVEQPNLSLGVIGNAALAALVDQRARIVWMCVPRLDGDPVFCSLMAGEAYGEDGVWAFDLLGFTRSEQVYHRNTAILETRLFDGEGNGVRIIDVVPRFKRLGRIFRPMTLVRRIEPIAGTPRISVRLRPRFDYGAHEPATTRGSNHIRYILGDTVLRLTTDAAVSFVQDGTPFILDRTLWFVLGPDETLTASPAAIGREFLEQTEAYWFEWVRYLSLPYEWQDVVIRSAITLKLCSNEETGGIVAALTTGVPEYGDTGRTWDYRYCWLRDSFFTVQALNRLGATKTMEDYLGYVQNIVAGSPGGYLQPLFGLGFETRIDERIAPALPGYRGLGPVRIGNAAYSQVQNDGYGSVILAIAQCFFDERLPTMGDVALFHRLEVLGEQAARRWSEPDAGIWEYRTRASVHTHSALMCWGACDRLARIATRLGLTERARYWAEHAAKMRAGIIEAAWNEDVKAFASTFGGADMDASTLLIAEVGLLSPKDPRFLSTVDRIERELRFGNHLFRYRVPDDFGTPETAFTACTFWLIDTLAAVGREAEAREVFEDVLVHRNPLGLLSEGIHLATGELWGNFPQTYSMVGLIKAAMRLSQSWENAF